MSHRFAERILGPAAARRAAYVEQALLDDGWFRVADVVCDAEPPPVGRPEIAPVLTVVFPVSGVFVREVHRGRSLLPIVGDPVHALVFRADEHYRVRHPTGGSDRSVTIGLSATALDDLGVAGARPGGERLPDAIPTTTAMDLLLRRWLARQAEPGDDPLEHGEVAAALVGAVLRTARVDGGATSRDTLVDRTRLVIAEDLGEQVTLPELGRRVGSSPFHLARRFRRATGSSIHGYRTALRVRAALERVAGGERDLTGLALDLGFADHSHLTNTVRRETGRPPSAFRLPPTDTELRALSTILQA